MVIKELIRKVSDTLKENGSDNPVFEAHLIIRTILSLSPIDVVLKSSEIVSEENISRIYTIAERRASGEPLQYILGTQEFMGMEFFVNPSVLIPRPETEILVEHVLEYFAGRPITALDLCTGSGCIAVSLAHFNKNAHVKGIDISEKAIETAKKNAENLGVDERVSFEVCDVFNMNSFGKYDLLISNPPYIKTEVIPALSKTVRSFEPVNALDGGGNGLTFYKHIINIAPKYLPRGGMLAFEIGYDQKEAVTNLMEPHFSEIKSIKDYSGNDRVVSGILI